MPETVAFSCPASFYSRFDRKDGDKENTHYCPGCGHGLVHKYVAEAIEEMGIQDRTILVNPVGCAVFAYYYLDVGNVQAPHGRCPAVATAIKRGHPDSIVVGYQGDGDLAAIGTGEVLHAANRGENLTLFFINNAIYGMTGGQMAPTSVTEMKTATTPRGRNPHNEGYPLRVTELLATLAAPYYLERVALGDNRHNAKARKAVRKALRYQSENRGFSLVEVLSPCPTGWKVSPAEAASWTLEQMTEVFPLGVFRDGHDLDLGHPRYRAEVALDEVPSVLGVDEDATQAALPDHERTIEEARFKIAGFGGQGVLLLGLALAEAGMLARRQVSWMPSYGPEMRGGTANCSVTVSDQEIGSPLIEQPTVLVAMNGPSLDRFAGDVVPGGLIFYNSSMIDAPPQRDDIVAVGVPASDVATSLGNAKVANMVILGAMLARCSAVSREAVDAALPRVKMDAALLELNSRALDAGGEAGRPRISVEAS